MNKTNTELIIDFIKKTITYEIAEHENTYHLDSDCTPVEERKAMEEAETKLHEIKYGIFRVFREIT